MASAFDPFANATKEDDPLSIFESTNDPVRPSNVEETTAKEKEDTVIPLCEFDSAARPSSHDKDDSNYAHEHKEEYGATRYESDDDVQDLLDVEGWNTRRRSSEDEVAPLQDPTDRVSLAASGGMWGYALNNGAASSRKEVHADDIGIHGDAGGDNKGNRSRRGLFPWGRRDNAVPSNYADSNHHEDSYSSIPPDGIDEAALAYGEGGITGDNDVSDAERIVNAQLEEEQEMDNQLRPGDHIYVWQTYGINPRAYQRHAVVLSVIQKGEGPLNSSRQMSLDNTYEPLSYSIDSLYRESSRDDDIEVTVVSFYHFQRHASHGAALAAAAAGNRRGKRTGCKTQLLYDFIGEDGIKRKKPVHKVRYGRQVKRGILNQKASVGTALKKDQVGLILARVHYLLDHPDHLPDHNALSANGECAAMWCVTGRWCTLQGASILQITCVGQAGGALVAGGILSNLTVLVPMPGLWGMAGWWWYVPATVAYPFLVPMLVALGMCSLVPLEILRRNRIKWRGITDGLNHEFWSHASDEVKEEYFGVMATAEKEAEMRSFFGVREGEASADDAKYMPVSGTPAVMDDSDDEEDEALAMQNMERNCQSMAADMNVDLSGKPPTRNNGNAW
ncbi:hypothetical protein ACHAWX_007532, partial [Stephanocyclus meneghinianus]